MALFASMFGVVFILAAKTREELFQEQVAGAKFYENLGYLLGILGVVIVVAAIPLGIYMDRRKKARKRPPDAD
jgi:hypothetical protein